jgi:hypothetical protein
MGLEQFLTEEDKIASLTEVRNLLFRELYALCVRAAIDPDTFEYENWEIPSIDETNTLLQQTYYAIAHASESIVIIDGKIGK